MAFFDFFKKNKETFVVNKENKTEEVKSENKEEMGYLLPSLKPLSIAMFDSVDMSRKKADEEFAKKYNIELKPLRGYDVI